MAAAIATIEKLRRTGAVSRLWHLGKRFMDGMSDAATLAGVPATIVGVPPMPYVTFGYKSESQNTLAMRIFCDEMLGRGVLLHPNHHWFVCAAMTEADIDTAVSQSVSSFQEVVRRIGFE